MNFNLINNLETCFSLVQQYVPVSVVYYTHILAILTSLLLGIFILINNKNIAGKIIFLITLFFSIWAFFDIFLWISYNPQLYIFFWSFTYFLEIFLFLFFIYFFYVFIFKKDINLKIKFLGLLITLPTILLINTSFGITYFNAAECTLTDALFYNNYALPLRGILLIFYVLLFLILIKNKENEEKKSAVLIFLGSFFFLILFFFSNILGNYFIEHNILSYIDGYKIEMYSLFAFPIFLGMLTFVIVRFRAFNIKLLGAQALVWALIILVGSQFLYMQDMPVSALVLTAVTLVFSSVLGLLVVRSVKKVDQQRELLAIANQNQQTLLHFVTHQVKGYITKSRNIFDGLIAKDYGDLPPKALEMVQHGFDSDTRAVETVMAILKASDLKTGKTEFKKEKTNISALVADVIEFRKDQAEQKGLELTFDIEPNIEIQVDSIQIKEVFKNLVTNSILYTPKGTVHVVLKRELGKVRFAVIDTGVGITPTDKARLFTEGGKGENSTTHNVDSTGYGLYIAKQIVERHQGTIGVISEGKDKGSEFFVLLPDVG